MSGEYIDAAVRLENRLTLIEAAQKATHTSVDNLIAQFGELRGFIDGRLTAQDHQINQRKQEHDALRQQIADRRGWERLQNLEERMEVREKLVSVDYLKELVGRLNLLERAQQRDDMRFERDMATSSLWRKQWIWITTGAGLGAALFSIIQRYI